MTDFDPAVFDQLAVLPPKRLRHHLGRFHTGLSEALEKDFNIDPLKASNLVEQALVLGFPSLARSLASAFGLNGAPSDQRPVHATEFAIKSALTKIAELRGKLELN